MPKQKQQLLVILSISKYYILKIEIQFTFSKKKVMQRKYSSRGRCIKPNSMVFSSEFKPSSYKKSVTRRKKIIRKNKKHCLPKRERKNLKKGIRRRRQLEGDEAYHGDFLNKKIPRRKAIEKDISNERDTIKKEEEEREKEYLREEQGIIENDYQEEMVMKEEESASPRRPIPEQLAGGFKIKQMPRIVERHIDYKEKKVMGSAEKMQKELIVRREWQKKGEEEKDWNMSTFKLTYITEKLKDKPNRVDSDTSANMESFMSEKSRFIRTSVNKIFSILRQLELQQIDSLME